MADGLAGLRMDLAPRHAIMDLKQEHGPALTHPQNIMAQIALGYRDKLSIAMSV